MRSARPGSAATHRLVDESAPSGAISCSLGDLQTVEPTRVTSEKPIFRPFGAMPINPTFAIIEGATRCKHLVG